METINQISGLSQLHTSPNGRVVVEQFSIYEIGKFKRILLLILILVITIFLMLALNFSFLQNFIIPDSCDYDTNKINTSYVFNLFYEVSSTTGYEPDPTKFNFLFTILIGVIIGCFVFYNLLWRKKIIK